MLGKLEFLENSQLVWLGERGRKFWKKISGLEILKVEKCDRLSRARIRCHTLLWFNVFVHAHMYVGERLSRVTIVTII